MRGNHLYSTQFSSKIHMHSAKQEGGNGQHEAQLSGAKARQSGLLEATLWAVSCPTAKYASDSRCKRIQYKGEIGNTFGDIEWKTRTWGRQTGCLYPHAAKLTGKEREVKQSWDGHPLKPQARGGTSGSHAPVGKLSPECLQTVPRHTEEISQMCCLGTRNTLTKNYTKISQTSKTYQLYWFWHQKQST